MYALRRTLLFIAVTLWISLAMVTPSHAQAPTNPDKANAPDLPGEPQPPAPEPPRPAHSQTVANFMPVGIPDNAYIGTLDGNDGFGTDAGMVCSSVNTSALLPAGAAVYHASVKVNATHSWVGDLTLKLRSPGGTILTLLNRPGSNAPDDGSDSPVGDNSNWSGTLITFGDGAGPEAETMGGSLTDSQSICTNDGVCAHDPSPDTAAQPPTAFSNIRTTSAAGVWTLCAGDSALTDVGSLNQWQLTLTAADTYSVNPGLTIPDDAYTGGFGGIGQACAAVNTTTPAPASSTVLGAFVNATLSHTWVGDLTMKVRSPNGTILTVLNRPGSAAPDDGSGAVGNAANWSNTAISFGDGFGVEAETMGNGLSTSQRICLDNGVCSHDPSPDTATQPPTAFSNFNGGAAAGTWQLCVGDSALGDVGTLNQWQLYLQRPVISLAVTLERMSATVVENGVRVAWETASEVDNIGFHLYRSTDPAFAGERLTIELIPSTVPGGGQGAMYEWVDPTAEPGVVYYYTLEDVDVNGVGTVHPSVPVTPATPTAVTLTGISTRDGVPLEWLAAAGVILLMVGQGWVRLQRRG